MSKRSATDSDSSASPVRAAKRKDSCCEIASVFVVAAGSGVRALVLAAGVGIQATFEGDEIVEELQRNHVREGSEPFTAGGIRPSGRLDNFRHNYDVIPGEVVVRRGRCDGDAKRFQFACCAKDLTGAIVGGPPGEKSNQGRA